MKPYQVLLCAATLLLPILASAQTTNAVITGRITDPSKALIVDARVTAINTGTNLRYEGATNVSGSYVIAALPPGNYRVEIEKAGFKTIVQTGVVLHVQDTVELNYEMALGAASESVTVTGGAPLVDTTDASVSTVIERSFVENLPLNGRSFNALLQLTPGVVIAATSTYNQGQFSIAGQRTSANNFLVDGVSANFGVSAASSVGTSGGAAQAFSALGGTSSLVSVEDLQEFRVETSSFAPEFGHSPGGQVILTTRSGTNDFHGGVYEYFRNNVLDANDWFANQAGQRARRKGTMTSAGSWEDPFKRTRPSCLSLTKGRGCGNPTAQSFRFPLSLPGRRLPPRSLPFWTHIPSPRIGL